LASASNAWVPSSEDFNIDEEKYMSDTPESRIPLKRALVSVYDKSGLDDLVRGLHDAGVRWCRPAGRPR